MPQGEMISGIMGGNKIACKRRERGYSSERKAELKRREGYFKVACKGGGGVVPREAGGGSVGFTGGRKYEKVEIGEKKHWKGSATNKT